MSIKNINIGEGELEIMKAVWKAKKPVSSSEIGKAVEQKGWKRTTIATFLSRLVEKGALTAEKEGRSLYYTPAITSAEYKKSQIRHLLKNVFDGSVKDFAVSLFDEEKLSDDEIKELRSVFDDKEK
ncbi:MAG: BlaI/MecI/CopY family transcriptional regulator [Firmicutes bacterium]|nr:BlaI/MecI/CopY family transcriptional regulator [Bacillota bacterium]